MNTFTKIIDGAKGGWNKIGTKKRIAMVALLIGMILVVFILNYFTKKVNYVTLFNNLEFEDAGIIVDDLEAKKISYRLENNGRKLLIDEKYIDKYRLQLAMNDMMPGNSSGFEIFDDIGLMVTDEDRKIMYQRALTGELQRSIMSLSAISSAKVHLVMSEKSIFETKEKEASASVILDIKPSHKITDDMIRGIVALVSGAVDNLPEKNIQVIDTKGNLLSNFLQKSDSLNAGSILNQYKKAQDEFEESIESNLYSLLEGAFGRDKIKVSVYADLDFDSEETTVTTYYDPVTRSEQISATGRNIDTPQVNGGNINDNVSNVIRDVDSDSATYNRTVNNELSSETKTIVKAPGKVRKLTASVLYDGVLSEENAGKIRNIVATSIGYDVNRGDLINVEGLVFDRANQEQPQTGLGPDGSEEGKRAFDLVMYGKYAIFALLGTLGILILVALAKAIFTKKGKSTDWAAQESLVTFDSPDNIKQTIDQIKEKQETRIDSKKLKAQEYAKGNPEIAAELIRSWIKNS